MAEPSSQSTPQQEVMVAIELVPIEDEVNDFATLALIESIQTDLYEDAEQLTDYHMEAAPTESRDAGLLLLIGSIVSIIGANRELITSMFNTIATALELLTKRGQIAELEIIDAHGRTIILRDLEKKTAKELLAEVEKADPQAKAQWQPQTSIKIRAKVSRRQHKKS